MSIKALLSRSLDITDRSNPTSSRDTSAIALRLSDEASPLSPIESANWL
jgi:hypothetical protein